MGSTDAFAGRPVVGQRMSAVDYVLRDLRDAVESGVIHVGERLPSEAALAARYSVSRTVIREVLRALEATGRTVTRDGKGTFVVATHPNEVLFEGYSAAHLMEARPGDSHSEFLRDQLGPRPACALVAPGLDRCLLRGVAQNR